MTGRGPRGHALVAVVLAGGSSRRFGSDKLDAEVAGRRLLDRAVEALPPDTVLLVVGPERPLRRPARFLVEQPAGGGPAAAIVTGLRAAVAAGAEEIVVLPGDAPEAGVAATFLLAELHREGLAAVVGTDATGVDQPLQLALTGSAATALVAAAGPDGATGGSARRLVNTLQPPAARRRLSTPGHWDVDTPQQLQAWVERDGMAVRTVLGALDELQIHGRPVVLALDGRSAAGKSTLASSLTLRRPATVLDVSDFFSTAVLGLDLLAAERLVDAEVAERMVDWQRLRADALEPLAAGRPASFQGDRQRTGDRRGDRVTLPAGDLVIVDGVFSGRPELADLVDLAVLVDVDEGQRQQRLRAREHDRLGQPAHLTGLRDRAESYYFAVVRQVEEFDLVVRMPTVS